MFESILVFSVLWCCLLTYLIPVVWLFPLLFLLSLVLGLATFGLALAINMYLIFPLLSHNSKYKKILTKSAGNFVVRYWCNCAITAEGIHKVPAKTPLIFYSNHKSKADPLILALLINRVVLFTPKAELLKVPFLGTYMNKIGCQPIYRQDDKKTARSVVKIIKSVKDGTAYVIYPEGTAKHKDSEEMSQTKIGAYKIALKAQADIIPLSIVGSSRISANFPFHKSGIKVIFHDLIKHEDIRDLSSNELAAKVESVINDSI
jgi:1-acyl-sn-glycerol-3-phosphate acyltransferase